MERYADALRRNNINYIDAASILKAHRDRVELYYKTDMHWNSDGASLIAKAIIDQLSEMYLEKKIWNEKYISGEISSYGGELLTMPLLFPKSEISRTLVSHGVGYEKQQINGVEVYYGNDRGRALLPSSIMFGNSFMLLYPDLGYHAYFKKSERVLNYEHFSKVLDYIKPDHKIFVLHIYENQLQFHLMPIGKRGNWSNFAGYWDPRISELPLPQGFIYK